MYKTSHTHLNCLWLCVCVFGVTFDRLQTKASASPPRHIWQNTHLHIRARRRQHTRSRIWPFCICRWELKQVQKRLNNVKTMKFKNRTKWRTFVFIFIWPKPKEERRRRNFGRTFNFSDFNVISVVGVAIVINIVDFLIFLWFSDLLASQCFLSTQSLPFHSKNFPESLMRVCDDIWRAKASPTLQHFDWINCRNSSVQLIVFSVHSHMLHQERKFITHFADENCQLPNDGRRTKSNVSDFSLFSLFCYFFFFIFFSSAFRMRAFAQIVQIGYFFDAKTYTTHHNQRKWRYFDSVDTNLWT